jgi:eukaryotic-like serine/threonine-protein kinase
VVSARLLPSGLRERQRIDRYELVGEIASGGMATVFLARRAGVGGFQRFVAVKRLHPHLANEAEFVQMFLDEARLAALIHHPNVVSNTEVGESERGYYLVMEYIEGDTLARLMAESTRAGTLLPLAVGLRIVIDMLNGLHAAHELRDEQGNPTGLVHRDVSPQNVLVGLDGISRISDFGVARAASRLAGTRVGQLKGKIAYMAPEQAAGDEMLDRRADVFASGIVLWEVLTGRRLFRASNDAATLSRVVSGEIEPPTRYVPGLDARVSEVCMKALERPLARRIASAAQFAELLETAATNAGGVASGRDVASYMQAVLGGELEQQREAIRRWIIASETGDDETSMPSGPRRAISSQYDEQDNTRLERLTAVSGSRPTLAPSQSDTESHDSALGRRRIRGLLILGLLLGVALVAVGAILGGGRHGGVPVGTTWDSLRAPSAFSARSSMLSEAAFNYAKHDFAFAGAAARGLGPDGQRSSAGDRLDNASMPAQLDSPPLKSRGTGVRNTESVGAQPRQSPVSNIDLSNPYR